MSAAGRNASLDALRVLSLLGIITLHVAAGGFHDNRLLGFVLDELSRFAVPVFFILSAWFWKPEELAAPGRLVLRVLRRVGVPFVAWVAVMVAWQAVTVPSHALDLSPVGLAFLLWTGGPAFHLWFLPALIVGTVIVAFSGRWFGWRMTAVLSVALFLLGTIVGSYGPILLQRVSPFWMDRNGIFFAPVFLVAGVLLRRHGGWVSGLPVPTLIAAVVLFALGQLGEGYLVVPRYPMGHDFSLSTLGYGISVVLLFMRLDLRWPVWSALGRATFTAYLAHVLVIGILVVELKLGTNSLLVIALTFAASLAAGVAWQWARGSVPRRSAAAR
ncbi:MAG: acyltransferase [Devosia sp.]|uniref:acyltransferase family protein n=1 Tax=Devosia sp. TaxID=1871048 RepID=UPI001ACDF1B4|nr:acyltransferase [Devosia sp.]MBN9316346.1 acyltransferase [Devosia sp.]